MRRRLVLLVLAACATTVELDPDARVRDARSPDAAPCDAADLDEDCTSGQGICARAGKTTCIDGHIACDALAGEPGPELCHNGLDDDCDGLIDEGFANDGMPCTSGMGACARTGTYMCPSDGAALVCDATPGEPGPELCGNDIDDDCNGTVDDGFQQAGQPCDGTDQDLCTEGTWTCSADQLSISCSDQTGDLPDICNGVDDDCDPLTPDGSQDPLLGQPCDAPDGICGKGIYVGCRDGALTCDGSATTRDTNPTCPGASLGEVSGDTGAEVLQAAGYSEADYQVEVSENNNSLVYLSVGVGLQSPAGVGFQLCAACFDCQSQRPVCDYQGPGGHAEVRLARDDASVDQSFPIEIEVIFVEGDPAACGDYTLVVTGNVLTDDRTCN